MYSGAEYFHRNPDWCRFLRIWRKSSRVIRLLEQEQWLLNIQWNFHLRKLIETPVKDVPFSFRESMAGLRAVSLEPTWTDHFSAHQMGAQSAWALQSRWNQRTCWVPRAGAERTGCSPTPELQTVPSPRCPRWWSWRMCWSSRWGGPLPMEVSVPSCADTPAEQEEVSKTR